MTQDIIGMRPQNTDPHLVARTVPGANLPGFAAGCLRYDDFGRCHGWSTKAAWCVNPEGMDQPEMVIPCEVPK